MRSWRVSEGDKGSDELSATLLPTALTTVLTAFIFYCSLLRQVTALGGVVLFFRNFINFAGKQWADPFWAARYRNAHAVFTVFN